MTKQTKRDKRILLIAVRFMGKQYRQNPTVNTANNIASLFAQRHRVAYDFSPIPCPVLIY